MTTSDWITKYTGMPIEQAIEELPSDIATVEAHMVDAQSAYEYAEQVYDKEYARESTVQFAKMKTDKMTAGDAKAWVDFNTLDKLLPVIQAKTKVNQLKVHVKLLENMFAGKRKLANLQEVEMRNLSYKPHS
jgi:hypothetical protein